MSNAKETEEEIRLKPFAEHTMRVARPLFWHDTYKPWPKKLAGGSCFVLRFADGLVGVTANHVVTAFESARAEQARTVCLLRTVVLDLSTALIDRDDTLDIATFRVTQEQLSESGGVALDCTRDWPPPPPQKGDALSFGGFPNVLQVEAPHDRYEFRAYVNLGSVEDVTERRIVAVGNGQRRMSVAPVLPETGGNYSGCSGGPVLLHIEQGGLHRWFPAGLILVGPGAAGEGLLKDIDVFQFRRIHVVNADGRLDSAGG